MDRVDLIRHFYRIEQGRQVMENTFGKVAHAPVDVIAIRQKMEKVSRADPELMKVALRLAGDRELLEVYKQLGGTFKKEALGAPMFQPPSMPASPALGAPAAGGVQAPKLQGAGLQQPSVGAPQAPQPQVPKPDQQQKSTGPQVKVQLQSPAPGQQGTSVSVG